MSRLPICAALGLTAAIGLTAIAADGEIALAADAPSALRVISSSCAASSVTGRPIPRRPSFNFGSSRLAVSLPTRATFVAVPEGQPGAAFIQADGWIRAKVGWWSPLGKPRVAGRRIDRPARPLRTDVGPLSWATSGRFYPSDLYFSSLGCWRISATAGGARLIAVVRVVTQ